MCVKETTGTSTENIDVVSHRNISSFNKEVVKLEKITGLNLAVEEVEVLAIFAGVVD